MSAMVTFFYIPFDDENGVKHQLTLSVTVEDGDFQGIIDTVKEDGGSFLTGDDGVNWFLPWPPAAIRIDAI